MFDIVNTTAETNVFQIQQQLAEGNKENAFKLAKHYVSQKKIDPSGWLVLGTLYKENDELKNALDCWQYAYSLDQNSHETCLFLLSGLNEKEGLQSSLAKTLLDKLHYTYDELTFTAESDPQLMSTCLAKRGMVLIRNILQDKDTLMKWEENRKYNTNLVGLNGVTTPMPLLFIAKQENENAFYHRYKNGLEDSSLWTLQNYTQSHADQILQPLNAMMTSTILPLLVADFLGKSNFSAQLDYSMVRYVAACGKDLPGGPHQDVRLQKIQDLYATFWIPFIACGGNRTPSLAVVPIRCYHYFPTKQISIGPEIPEELYFKPEFEVGDLLIQSSFSIHRSNIRKEMQGWRSSVDIRFF